MHVGKQSDLNRKVSVNAVNATKHIPLFPYIELIPGGHTLVNEGRVHTYQLLQLNQHSSVARGGAGVAVAPPEHLRKKLAPFQLSPFLKLFLNFNINLLICFHN